MRGPIDYIKESWAIYTKQENFVFFAKTMSIFVIVSTLLGFATAYFYPADNSRTFDPTATNVIAIIALVLTSIIVNLWSQSTLYLSLIKMGTPAEEVLKLGFKNIGRYFLVSLTLGLIFMAGIILLIIPAFIFSVWYLFTTYLVFDKNMGIKEALGTSKKMVEGKFWALVGRMLVFGLFAIVVGVVLSIIPYAGTLLVSFVSPLFMLPSYLLYKDLNLSNKNLSTPQA